MRISFDLDDTLICLQDYAKHEPNKVPLFLQLWFKERLRLGTCQLIQELRDYGWEICIYTTSYRSLMYLRLWLWFYGIEIKDIINQDIHQRYLQNTVNGDRPSKNPRLFGIDLHVDDSEGVKQEGAYYGFQVCLVSPEDENWTEQVILCAREYLNG